MKHQVVSIHGWSHFFQGQKIILGALAVCALLFSPLISKAAPVTQLGFVKILAQTTGATADLSGSDADFIEWAGDLGIDVDNPDAAVNQNDVAETLVQLLKLNPKKFGGDVLRNLQREGINVPQEITRESLMELIAGNVGPRLPDVVPSPSPVRGGRPGGKIPPGFLNPRNPHFGTPVDQLPGAQGIANAQNRGNRR